MQFYPFFLDGVALQPAMNQPDGMHPNEQGVAHIATKILPQVKTLLDLIKLQSSHQGVRDVRRHRQGSSARQCALPT